jgi:hypothetical protein
VPTFTILAGEGGHGACRAFAHPTALQLPTMARYRRDVGVSG